MTLALGTPAPDFRVPDAGGALVGLDDFRGKKTVVLYFYPKDETPGCTVEACGFRDQHEAFVAAGAAVLGVSSDSVASHQRFAARHQLPFTLLSDEDGALRKRYQVGSTLGILPGRVTYVIDRAGVIRHVYDSQLRAGAHVDKALAIVKQLEADAAHT